MICEPQQCSELQIYKLEHILRGKAFVLTFTISLHRYAFRYILLCCSLVACLLSLPLQPRQRIKLDLQLLLLEIHRWDSPIAKVRLSIATFHMLLQAPTPTLQFARQRTAALSLGIAKLQSMVLQTLARAMSFLQLHTTLESRPIALVSLAWTDT